MDRDTGEDANRDGVTVPDPGSAAIPGTGSTTDPGPGSTAVLRGSAPDPGRDPDARWFGPVLHLTFFLLLAASLTRFLLRHPGEPRTPWIIALSITLALLQILGPTLARHPRTPHTPRTPHMPRTPRTLRRPHTQDTGQTDTRRLLWLAAVVTVWVVVVLLAPSFAWCAVPLFYTGLRTLPAGAASVLVGLLTAFVVAAQLRLSTDFDPILVLAPPAVAALATAVFVHMERQASRQRALIDDLLRTRRELAATERREGTLAERQRLSMEIHDTLAQGLSSQQMLLQAADRTWDSDPATARGHLRTATEITARNLAEARRFVHDLAPADLAGGTPLPEALRRLATRTTGHATSPTTGHTSVHATGPTTGHASVHATGPTTDPATGPTTSPTPGPTTGATPGPTTGATTGGPGGDGPGGRLSVRFHQDGTPVPLPDRVQSALLRIAQGALANVREQAAAHTVTLTLSYLDDQVVLDIADDGRGFTTAAAQGRGHGLPAMHARMRQLGGTLTIESAPGEGTVLSAAVPLERTP
ncbi:sensor histidine kinase [Streptomyces sp. NPDC048197]|uniref:sensor histidine kinase n=1 Tax=Streptomyces sp. NPDC048197 TaxID=3365511 RepID=UPI003717554F